MIMDFNKVNFEKKWKKLDCGSVRFRGDYEPVARITKTKCLSFNMEASNMAKDLKFDEHYVDLYQAGNEFALSTGGSFRVNFATKNKNASARVSSQAPIEKIFAATKCKAFRVRQEGRFLVLTPAYDLERAGEDE